MTEQKKQTQQQQLQRDLNRRQTQKTDLREVFATFVTEGVKAAATGGMSLGVSLEQASLKAAVRQSVKTATRQGFRKTATKVGKVAGQAAVGTAQKIDNQDDNNMEMAEMGMALLNRGRGMG